MEKNKKEPMSKIQIIFIVFAAIFMTGTLAFLCCRFYGLHEEYAWINGMYQLCSGGVWLCSGVLIWKQEKLFAIFSFVNAVAHAIATVLTFLP